MVAPSESVSPQIFAEYRQFLVACDASVALAHALLQGMVRIACTLDDASLNDG
jgi:hypothetical protein